MSTFICSGYCSFVCFLLLSNAWTIFSSIFFIYCSPFPPKHLLLRISYFDIFNFDSHLCSSWFECINRHLGLSVSTCLKNIVFSWLLTRCAHLLGTLNRWQFLLSNWFLFPSLPLLLSYFSIIVCGWLMKELRRENKIHGGCICWTW